MGTLRHLMLFSLFGIVGIGLALGIGLSSDAPPRRSEPQAGPAPGGHALARPAAERRDRPDERPAAPATQGLVQLPPLAADVTVPREPMLAAPYPPRTYRFAAGPPPVPEAPAPLPSPENVPAPAGPVPGGSHRVPPATPGGGAGPTVRSEGDGQLRLNVQDTDIRRVLELISEQGNLNILASKNVQGKVSATLNGVNLQSALEAILRSTGYIARREGKFIYVGTPADIEEMEHSMDRVGTRVYRPNYVKASDLKDLITPLLTEKVGVVSVTAPSEVGIGSDDTQVGGDKFAGNEALLVRDYEAVLTQVDQVVAEIDIRPMQVHIEAMILSVRLGDRDKFGVNFRTLLREGATKALVGWGLPIANLGQVALNDGSLQFGFVDGDVSTFLDALEQVADTNVIASPSLMVLNKHRADILIGRQEGYVSTTQTETATTQNVEFLDLGTQLRLRPFITPDGLIRMEVHPELSDGSVEVQGNFTLPNKDVTQVTTNIMVRDGCTVIIGGLMQEQLATTTTQIPFFGNLPVVGVLFRNKEETINRREIIVLITPHIVYEPETCREGEKAACEFTRRQDVYREKMSPAGKRSVGRRYFRLAQRAWALGDRRRAMRFAEMAVHFDPLNRAAIDLRSDIWLGKPVGEHTLPPAVAAAAPPPGNPLDGQAIAPWLLDSMENPVPAPPMPRHPLDPGRPGVHRSIEQPRKLQ